MKITEFKNLTIKELNSILDEKRKELAKLRIDINLGRVNTSNVLRQLKKDVARLLTELNIRRIS